jgi:hypothetical protein
MKESLKFVCVDFSLDFSIGLAPVAQFLKKEESREQFVTTDFLHKYISKMDPSMMQVYLIYTVRFLSKCG